MKPAVYFVFSLLLSIKAWSQSDHLQIAWPDDWKVGSEQKTRTQMMTEYIPKKEKIDDWTILGTTTVYIGRAGVPIEAPMNMMFNGAKKNAINPTLTLVEKKADGDHPWILFKIESEGFTDDKTPESQLFFIIEGENDLYSNFVAIKKASLSREFVDHWAEIFKSSQFTKK